MNLMAFNAESGKTGNQEYLQVDEEFYTSFTTISELASIKSPLVSLVMPVYDAPAFAVTEAIHSIRAQTYSNWELCIVDDCSNSLLTIQAIESALLEDTRIRLKRLKANAGISAASNIGIDMSRGEFIGFIDHDDILANNALSKCMKALVSKNADAVYTDQATIDDKGVVIHEFRKPCWSPQYLKHVMYVGHLLMVRRRVVEEVGGFRSDYDGVQDYEFMLRVSEKFNNVEHIPEVLYYWRAIPGSLALSEDAKDNISLKQSKAVQSHIERMGISAEALPHPDHAHRCQLRPILKSFPRVSIVIPTKDQPELIHQCLKSIREDTVYPHIEVICVDTGTTDSNALIYQSRYSTKVLKYSRSDFNFSAACNEGAMEASGEILIFLNNDTKVINSNWIDELIFYLQPEDVGVAGPLLLYPNNSVQHAGVVLGCRGTADHAMRNFPECSDGYAGSLSCPREVSAVTGACLAIKSTLFKRLGGFSELYFTHYQDVDLCLKVRSSGYRIIYTPSARLYHFESISRGGRYDYLDRMLFMDTWRCQLKKGDPYYNPNLCIHKLDYSSENASQQ